MSFFKRKAKNKEPEPENNTSTGAHSPSLGLRNHHVVQDASGPSPVAISAISANMDSFARGRTAILKKQPSHMEAAHFGDLGHSSVNYQPQETRCRLSKSVEQVLRDAVALPHYTHFLELRGVEHLVRFWLEAESFRSSSWSRVRAHSLNSVKHSSLAEPVSIDASDPAQGSPLAAGPPSTAPSPQHPDTEPIPGSPLAETPHSQNTPLKNQSSRISTPLKNQSSSALRDLSQQLIKSIEKDAVSIFTRYISPDAPRPIPISEPTRTHIIAKICGEDGLVDPNCFMAAQAVTLSVLEQQHFSDFLRSHHFCKYQIEVLTSGAVYLRDVLYCESALFYYSEYMEKEEAVNVLQFWLAADNFQNQLASKSGQYDGQEAQNDAMILYDKYFSLQATHPLGFGDSVRMEIESNICREGGPLPDCFTTPLRQAWTTMEKVYMPGFLSSNLYYKYLSDLINSVRADEFVGVSGQSAVAADTGSTVSESTQAQQSARKAAIKILKNFDEAITVDAASLDPEVLYQRPYAGKMTFGKVNELGQFIREAEPEPDVKKSKGSMFSQAMKKWVQGNSDEAQEEMAWKIAKMIVNDVVQQGNQDSPVKTTKL